VPSHILKCHQLLKDPTYISRKKSKTYTIGAVDSKEKLIMLFSISSKHYQKSHCKYWTEVFKSVNIMNQDSRIQESALVFPLQGGNKATGM
jgi:hypothetical protein